MHYFHWIAGTILALAWFSRIIDAAIGMPSVANIYEAGMEPQSGCRIRQSAGFDYRSGAQ